MAKTKKIKREDLKVGVIYSSPVLMLLAKANSMQQYDRKLTRIYASMGVGAADTVEFVRRGPRNLFAGRKTTCKLSSFLRSAGPPVAK